MTETLQQPQTQDTDQNIIAIYDRFIEMATMPEDEVKKLTLKRGLSRESIEEAKLRTTGSYLNRVLGQLLQEFDRNILLGTPLFKEIRNKKTGDFEIELHDRFMQEENIIIPYLDKQGRAYKLRIHKFFLPGDEIDFYCPFFLKPLLPLVITEAEFKEMALRQLGFNAIGIPGISSFSNRHFERLIEALKSEKITEITILFDLEDKGNPLYPDRCKSDFWNRWDSEFWAYIMAYKLDKAGFSCKIARFPEEWMIDGKVDCDGALANGKTKEDFDKVISGAMEPGAFRDSLKPEAHYVVNRKIAKYFHGSKNTVKKFNSYYYVGTIEKGRGENKETVPVEFKFTNFTAYFTKIVERIDETNKVIETLRYIKLKNEFGEESREILLHPSFCDSLANFKKFLAKSGNYQIFSVGIQRFPVFEELFKLWNHEYRGAHIMEFNEVGKLRNFWLFGNCYIRDGETIWANGHGLIQKAHEAIMAPVPGEELVPILSYQKELSVSKILNLFYKNLEFNGVLAFSFVIATLFSDVIFSMKNEFPIFFLFGKTQSGKNVLGRWLLRFFGIRGDGKNISRTTEAGMIRMLARLSNLPLWLDEFGRNLSPRKVENLKNIYNRSSYVQAEFSNDLKTKSPPIKGTLMLSGQATPDDSALFSRCVFLNLSKYKRKDEYFTEIEQLSENFSSVLVQILRNEQAIQTRIKDDILSAKDELMLKVNDSRHAFNYGCLVGALIATIQELGIEPELEFTLGNFKKWAIEEFKQTGLRKEQKDELLEFFDDINFLLRKDERIMSVSSGDAYEGGYSDKNFVHFTYIDDSYYSIEGELFYFALPAAFKVYEQHHRQRTGCPPPFSSGDIMSYLQKEPYYKGVPNNETQAKRMKGTVRRAVILDSKQARIFFPAIFDKEELNI